MSAVATLEASGGQIATQSVATGGAIATAAGLAMHAAWVPIVGAAVAGVTLALALIFGRKGPQQKVISTHIVDDLEPQLKANRDGYLSGPRTRASQAQALANFDSAWSYLKSMNACGNPDLGDPGKRCISDRDRGGKWDWFALYRDPIANDPEVRDAVTAGLDQVTGGSWLPVLAVGLIAVGVFA